MKHISEIMTVVCNKHGITMNQGKEMKTEHDGDAIEHDGKSFHFEMLENGLLRTYDYECQWALTYKQVDGEWQPSNMVAMGTPYRGIVAKLNAAIQPTFSVGDGGEPMI